MAITICLYGTVVTSPAAKMPGTLVLPLAVDDLDLAARRQREGSRL